MPAGGGRVECSAAFDGGNAVIDRVDVTEDGAARLSLRLRADPFTEGTDRMRFARWFYFRVSGVRGRRVEVSLRAHESGRWDGYRPVASYDRDVWFRCRDARYDAGALRWGVDVPADRDVVWFAEWAPYSYDRHRALVARCAASPLGASRALGATLDGRPIDMLSIGTGRRHVWVTARQHPGETMSEWCAEGLVDRLLDPGDPLAARLRAAATFHVVPNMNPDGSVRGHRRTNACGANLNREWAATQWKPGVGYGKTAETYPAPSLARSPEVVHVLAAMEAAGCDAFIDLHGDHVAPANYLTTWNRRQAGAFAAFNEALMRANPDHQLENWSFRNQKDMFDPTKPVPKLTQPTKPSQVKQTATESPKGWAGPNKADMRLSSNQVAKRFGCLSAILEMPFTDTHYTPDPEHGWSPLRAARLGRSLLDAFDAVIPLLKVEAKL